MAGSVPLVATANVDGTGLYFLDHIAPVSQLAYTTSFPGGPLSLTCVLEANPRTRHAAIEPGRRVYVFKGLGAPWEGRLLEPVPGDSGWTLTADGVGAFGDYYRADYVTWTASNIITRAVNRGLRWIPGQLNGGYLAQPPDSASMTITAALTQMTQVQAWTWQVHKVHAGWQVDFVPLPTVPTRLLTTSVPQARTLAGYVNTLYVKYQSAGDKGATPAAYSYQIPTIPASIARHDRMEEYWDISSGGTLSAATALGYGNAALAKYKGASYQGAITVQHGEYTTMGGAAVDLALEKAGEVVQLQLADGPYGGEIMPTPPITFVVGKTNYTAATDSLEITPYQAWNDDISTTLTVLAPVAPA